MCSNKISQIRWKYVIKYKPYKAAGIDGLTGKFLKVGAPYLSSRITQLNYLLVNIAEKFNEAKPMLKK